MSALALVTIPPVMKGMTAVGGEKSQVSQVPGRQNAQCEPLWMEVGGSLQGFPKSERWREVQGVGGMTTAPPQAVPLGDLPTEASVDTGN